MRIDDILSINPRGAIDSGGGIVAIGPLDGREGGCAGVGISSYRGPAISLSPSCSGSGEGDGFAFQPRS